MRGSRVVVDLEAEAAVFGGGVSGVGVGVAAAQLGEPVAFVGVVDLECVAFDLEQLPGCEPGGRPGISSDANRSTPENRESAAAASSTCSVVAPSRRNPATSRTSSGIAALAEKHLRREHLERASTAAVAEQLDFVDDENAAAVEDLRVIDGWSPTDFS